MELVHFVKTADITDKIEALFHAEKKKLTTMISNLEIEQVGGTSVPGSISKGDLDINIRVEPARFEAVKELLQTPYEVNQPDNWSATFASFKDDPRNLGIQLTVIGSHEDFFVLQRNYLRNHPEKVLELNALKEQFEGKSMDEYRKKKQEFFESIDLS